ncbi:conserved protein of unknown function [Hyphomicrobium sp. 1Nfss2.1]|uniref:hypothetical protein n=1 Tax=Hyphomicrobium sp. 1Nfss2.1 TaxID=3413936 RepID=UPI003C7A6F67
MSNSQGASAGYSGGGRDADLDPQRLVGLLENLVPLLLHLQTQSFGQAGPLGYAEGRGARLEQQAAVAFTEDVILDALRNLSTYVQRNSGRYQGLDAYGTVIADARRALAAQDYQRALTKIFEMYRAIAVMRAIRPELPPVRQRGQDEMQGAGDVVH